MILFLCEAYFGFSFFFLFSVDFVLRDTREKDEDGKKDFLLPHRAE